MSALCVTAVRLLVFVQVGTKDGRVKIFGSDGVECTFRSPFQTATKQLQFLENKGTLLRLTTVRRSLRFCEPMFKSILTCIQEPATNFTHRRHEIYPR